MNTRRVAVVAAGILAVGGIFWWRTRPPAPPAVQAGVVRRAPLEAVVSVEGQTRATTVSVAPRTAQRVSRFLVREGDKVAAGQALVALDDRDAAAALREAQALRDAARLEARQARETAALARRSADAQRRQALAGLDEARARLRGLREGGRPEAVAQAEHQRDQLRAVAAEARRAWERAQALLAEGAVSQADVDRAKARATAADQEAAAAEDALAQVKAGATPQEREAGAAAVRAAAARYDEAMAAVDAARARDTQVRTLESRERQAVAAVERARAQRADAVLRAPFAGVVARRVVDPGALVGPGSPALVLVQPESLYVEALVPDEDSARIHVGQAVRVTAAAWPGRRFAGVVRSVSAAGEPRADASSRTYVVRARVALREGRDLLRPGMEVDVAADYRSPTPALLVPADAVVPDGARAVVWRIADGRVRRVPVGIGATVGNETEVDGDLNDGDLLVVSGKEGLRDGERVTVAASAGSG